MGYTKPQFEEIDILVLDYNKPEETLTCLKSIQTSCIFPHRVILCSNGGAQDYIQEYYNQGYIDVLILNNKNEGLGFGTELLFKAARSKYVIYLQNDQYFRTYLAPTHIEHFKNWLEEDPSVKCLSLAGTPCGPNVYSERAHFISREFYLGLEDLGEDGKGFPRGGCGPYWDGPESYDEGYVQRIFKKHGWRVFSVDPQLVMDNGKTAIRETEDGGIFEHECDTKVLRVICSPKTRQKFPNDLTDEEWEQILKGEWPEEGKVPQKWKEHSFIVRDWH